MSGVNLLVGLLCLGIIAGSNLIAAAACLLLIFKFANLNTVFSILERRGLEMGLLFLIITLLIPLANGQVGGQEIINSMTSLSGVLAITGGAVATYLNTIGIRLMRIDPEVVFGLVIGSIFGVVFLRGVPVGHIAAVGFDLYSRLLEEEVREAKGEEAAVPAETSIELPVEAYIPDAYIPDTNQKVAIYKRIASFDSLEEIPDMEDELVDRYGDLPAPVNNLLAVARIRVLAGKLKIKSISLVSNQLRLLLHPGQTLAGEDLVAAGSHYPNRVKYSVAGEEFEIKLRLAGKGQVETSYLLEQVEAFLNILGGSRHKAPLPGESPVVVNESNINI